MARENAFDVISSGLFDKLHILAHPFWYNEKELTIEQSISGFIKGANWERYCNVRDNIRDLDEIMSEAEVYR